jgi:hypothetical protein
MFSFTLPNGIKINPETLVDRVIESDEWPKLFLDTITGVVISVPNNDSLGAWLADAPNSQHSFQVEPFTIKEKSLFAKDFIDVFLVDELSKAKLNKVSSLAVQGEIDLFEDFLDEETDGFTHAWNQYLFDEADEYVTRWLTENPKVKITQTFEGCGDCEICKTMKERGGEPNALIEAIKTEQIMQSVTNQMLERQRKDLGLE